MKEQDRKLVEEAREVRALVYAALVERLGPVERALLLRWQGLGIGADTLEQRVTVRGPNFRAEDVREALRTAIGEVRALTT